MLKTLDIIFIIPHIVVGCRNNNSNQGGSMEEYRQYEEEFSESGFWAKVRQTLGKVDFLVEAVALFYSWSDPDTPKWVKIYIAGALGYFIFPFDLIPDFVFLVGYVDDAAVIVHAVKMLSNYITDEHWEKAQNFFQSSSFETSTL